MASKQEHELGSVADPLLITKNLSKTYRSGDVAVEAVRNVNLRVHHGEFVAVIGPSGCGKSTLLHLLGGLDQPSGGEIHLRSQRIDTLSEAARSVLRRQEIGFVFQFFNLVSNLSVADNIELPALLAGRSPSEALSRRSDLLEELGLADKSKAMPHQLSGGEQQRVALARALINQPALLLADEPTGNLNARRARGVMDLLRRYHEHEQTVVLVTHDARVASVADRVLFMRDGSLRDEATLTSGGDPGAILTRLVELEA